MDQYGAMMGAALVTSVLCVIVRQRDPGLGSLLSLAGCAVILLAVVRFFAPIIDLFDDLQALTGFPDAATAPLYKTIGIGILTQITASVCEDAGEKTVAKAVELAGCFFALYVSLPLITSVLDLFQETLGG